mgnify:FL=1
MENFNNKTWLDYSVYCGEKLQLYHGDCLEVMDLMIEDKTKVDMILCDLPYGTTACKWDTIIPFEDLWERYEKLIKPNGAIVLTASQPFTSALIASNFNMFKYCWVWKKSKSSNFLQSNYQPRKIHEDICVFSKGKASYTKNGGKMAYYPIMWGESKATNKGQNADTALNSWNGRQRDDYRIKSTNKTGQRYPESILEFKNDNDKLHPTMKPLLLIEYLIKTYTNEGETVLDNCIGSGTTAVACQNTGRECIGIEKDKTYFDLATKRLNDIWSEKLNKQVNELF